VSQQTRKVGFIVLTCLIITSAIICLSAEGRFRLHLFEFGVRHGIEDKQTGITYATDAPGLKVFRNSERWTQGDKLLVYRMMADPLAASRRESSIFMTGYNCGYYSVVVGIVVAVVIVVFYSMHSQRHRAKQRLGASQDAVL